MNVSPVSRVNTHAVLHLEDLLHVAKRHSLPTPILSQLSRRLDGILQELHQHRPCHDVACFRVACDASAEHEATECVVANAPLHTGVPGGQDSQADVGALKVHPTDVAPPVLFLVLNVFDHAFGVFNVRVHLFAVL